VCAVCAVPATTKTEATARNEEKERSWMWGTSESGRATQKQNTSTTHVFE
jgi:hypothetical protein